MTDINNMYDVDMDIAIAVEVMGWHRFMGDIWSEKLDDTFSRAIVDWHPSTDWRDAGMVLEHLANSGLSPQLLYDDNGHWALTFEVAATCRWEPEGTSDTTLWAFAEAHEWADTPTRAICEAAVRQARVREDAPHD